MPAPPGEGMTGSPHPGPAHQPKKRTGAGAHDATTSPDAQGNGDHTLFSEPNSIRPLGVRLQDLRPLRGRPPADPGPTRLTGVHPDHIGEEQTWSTTKPSPLDRPRSFRNGPTRLTGVHPDHIGEEQTWSTTKPSPLDRPRSFRNDNKEGSSFIGADE